MRFAIEVVPFGELAEPLTIVRLARAAEGAGWEGIFLWDHTSSPWGSAEAWTVLSGVATVTERLLLGTFVTAIPRRTPFLLAHSATTLDRMSNGRVILGAGLGTDFESETLGLPSDARVRAEMTDEALEVVTQLWSGKKLDHRGKHFVVEEVTLAPLPVQEPRIPIWIGGDSSPALRRAARWDGWAIGNVQQHDSRWVPIRSPEQIADIVSTIRSTRAELGIDEGISFDIAITGVTDPDDSTLRSEFEEAGVTWWLEGSFGLRGSAEDLIQRIQLGPP